MPEIKYYFLSYGMLFIMAGAVLMVTTFSMVMEAIIRLRGSKQTAAVSRFLSDYDEIMDIINYQGARPSELELAARSFIRHFMDLPPRNQANDPKKLQMLKSKFDFVYDFAKHPQVDEKMIEKLRGEIYRNYEDYRPDFEKQIEKALSDKKHK